MPPPLTTRSPPALHPVEQILDDLGLADRIELLFHPSLAPDERPEMVLTVLDSELEGDFLTPAERARRERAAREEELRRLREHGDDRYRPPLLTRLLRACVRACVCDADLAA